MNREKLMGILEDGPVIAAVKDDESLDLAVKSDLAVIFLLYGNVLTVGDLVNRAHEAGKVVFVHLDLIDGLSSREVCVDFIAGHTAADGVLSTKAPLTRRAKELGLLAIQRFFLLDSMALQSMEKQLVQGNADIVEVLPGLMPKIIRKLVGTARRPIIVGGLICDKEDVVAALGAGAVAVSTTNHGVWAM